MSREVVCPICQTKTRIEESSVGCYVLCSHCPHRFYVEAPTLGESGKQVEKTAPSVVIDYHAVERLLAAGNQGASEMVRLLRWQKSVLIWLVVSQSISGLLLLWLIFMLWQRSAA